MEKILVVLFDVSRNEMHLTGKRLLRWSGAFWRFGLGLRKSSIAFVRGLPPFKDRFIRGDDSL
jgi:hypothetical protein